MRNGAHVISILTTCRGRERPGDQMWLAGEGFEREEKELKRERILVRGGIFTTSVFSRD